MKSASKGLFILVSLSFLGLWGCSQHKSAQDSKIRELETRHAKLAEDYQTVTTAHEALRKRLAAVEAQRAELARRVEELQLVVKERDDLRHEVTSRTGERDALHAQLVQFSRELQGLVGRIDAATNNAPRAVTVSLD